MARRSSARSARVSCTSSRVFPFVSGMNLADVVEAKVTTQKSAKSRNVPWW